MKKTKFLLLAFILIYAKANCQIITKFKNLVNTKKDTVISLQYFKYADSTLLSKIDSFDLFLTQAQYELDTTYFYKVKFTSNNNKLDIAICYQSQYHDYLMLTNLGGFEKVKSKLKVFAFFFYKNRLILCTTYRGNINNTEESKKLVKNLIYENINQSEKKLVDNMPKEIVVQEKPLKGYSLD